MAEVGAPEQEFFLGDFLLEAAKAHSEFLRHSHAQQKPVVLAEVSLQRFSCRSLPPRPRRQGLPASASVDPRRALRCAVQLRHQG